MIKLIENFGLQMVYIWPIYFISIGVYFHFYKQDPEIPQYLFYNRYKKGDIKRLREETQRFYGGRVPKEKYFGESSILLGVLPLINTFFAIHVALTVRKAEQAIHEIEDLQG